MQEASVSTQHLLSATLRTLVPFLALATLMGLVCAGFYVWRHSLALLPVVAAAFFAPTFFSAPLALSSFRTGLRPFGDNGRKISAFCFLWGAIVVALFMLTLQLWQGMKATSLNYVYATVPAGVVCVAASFIPSRW
jgi:hypothetical protein